MPPPDTDDLATPEEAARAVHLPTMLLLFSFMVISAQMRLGGFYSAVTRRIAALRVGPMGLLATVIFVAGALSAVFSNAIVCLAVAPLLAEACLRRRLDPVPYLLALACASNIGSAATLIGNPQNMLIGEVLRLPFGAYARDALLPVVLGLLALWAVLAVPGGLLLPRSPVAARVSPDAPFGAELPEDQRAEAYSVAVDQRGARVAAATAEGLLRAQATLMQLLGPDGTLPYCRILDWPLFRLRRCAGRVCGRLSRLVGWSLHGLRLNVFAGRQGALGCWDGMYG